MPVTRTGLVTREPGPGSRIKMASSGRLAGVWVRTGEISVDVSAGCDEVALGEGSIVTV
jgi:hypothetical protein